MSDIDAIKRVLLGEKTDRMRKLDLLVRQGMMSPAQLPMLHRGLEKLQAGKTLNPNERASVARVMDSLLYIVTGDDTVFQRAKQHTQKNRYQTEEQDPLLADELPVTENGQDVELTEEEIEFGELVEKNVPTNPQLWSKYKAQAKSKFDVYPSAYANGWAAKMYKKAGGGWKSEAKEEVEQMQEELPDHLKKILDKKGNIDPKKVPGAKKSSAKVTDVTPKGYGPKEEVEIDEKVKDMSMGEVIKDFQKSDAPQFKGKSKEKKREMAIAAKLSAEEDMKEGYYKDMDTKKKEDARLARKPIKLRGFGPDAGKSNMSNPAARAALMKKEEAEQVNEYITAKQVKMAKGIANDPRHKGGDMTGAAKKMEKIKKGLSNHPGAQKALRQANEEFADYTDEEFDALIEMSYKDKFQAMLKKRGKSLADMSDDEKKSFFNSVDAAHKAKNENFMSDIKGQLNSKKNAKASDILAKRKADNEKAVKDMKTMAPHMKNPALGEEVEQIDEITAAQQAARDAKQPGAMKGLAPTKKDKPDLVHKEPKKGQKQPHGEHIVVQMRKAITANKPVQFKDGSSKVVNKAHAHKFLSKYMSSKPAKKEEMHGAHDSHDSFMKHVNDK